MKDEEMARWKNAEERKQAERLMKEQGYILTGVYGGIGPFGGEEVGIFRKDNGKYWWEPD